MRFQTAWLAAIVLAACASACTYPANTDGSNKAQASRSSGYVDTGAGGGGGGGGGGY